MRSQIVFAPAIVAMFAVACGPSGSGDAGNPPSCFSDAAVPGALAEGGVTVGNERIGDDGRLRFHIVSGELLVTYPWRPLLAGTHEDLAGSRTELIPRLSVTAEPATVATATVAVTRQCCTNNPDGGRSCDDLPDTPANCGTCSGTINSTATVTVRPVSTGEAVLTLRTDDGARFESVPVSVRAAATMQVFRSGVPASTVMVAVDGTANLAAQVFDNAGMQLQARYGITVTSSDPNIVRVRTAGQIFDPYSASVESYNVVALGMRPGTATLTFHANMADTVVTVVVQ